ncbi:hypothetical protein Intca_0530 [Intrasporangium calvum DSM 43043]|uniref:Uncharacterized protein n=1 Tax=Intrasporangium calvum (strain ATCC 23552 / DSM 43043 / JCM 3097 / NBRC 12989 / NCIMB 10167 / NRRL B-3866 / 7 KIP) TaxID=710696 RepID=E6S999_INTC7|nr:hypothetical protein Intca_0530 [Intrasporangium calvum DSM 43043]
MSHRKRGGPGHGRGLPASRPPGHSSGSPHPIDGQSAGSSTGPAGDPFSEPVRDPSPSEPPIDAGFLGAAELREHLRRTIEASTQRRPSDVIVTGTVTRAEVETGPLVLTDPDGRTWELVLPPGWAVDVGHGARVTVRGDLVDEPSSTQLGPRLRVRSLSAGD